MENLVKMGKNHGYLHTYKIRMENLVKMGGKPGAESVPKLTWSAGLPGDVRVALVPMGTALTATTLVTSRTVTTRDKVVSVEETFRRKPAGERYRWRNIFFIQCDYFYSPMLFLAILIIFYDNYLFYF